MDIKEVSAIIKLDKSLRDEVRKAEQKRDEIEQSIKSRVEKLHDEYYSDLDSVLSEYEAKKKGETIYLKVTQQRLHQNLDVIQIMIGQKPQVILMIS